MNRRVVRLLELELDDRRRRPVLLLLELRPAASRTRRPRGLELLVR